MNTRTKNTLLIILSIIVILTILFFVLVFFKVIQSSEPIAEYAPDCSSNTYNCDDFLTQIEAQTLFERCGGLDNDFHGLDKDGNGIACESLI